MNEYIKTHNPELYSYFPPQYFNSSQAPLINVMIRDVSFSGQMNLNVIQCRFRDEYNQQILGIFNPKSSTSSSEFFEKTYSGALLRINSYTGNY